MNVLGIVVDKLKKVAFDHAAAGTTVHRPKHFYCKWFSYGFLPRGKLSSNLLELADLHAHPWLRSIVLRQGHQSIGTESVRQCRLNNFKYSFRYHLAYVTLRFVQCAVTHRLAGNCFAIHHLSLPERSRGSARFASGSLNPSANRFVSNTTN